MSASFFDRPTSSLRPSISCPAAIVAAAVTLLCSAAGQASLITVDTTVDEFDSNTSGDMGCSLREAVYAANEDVAYGSCASGSGADIIILPAGTYNLVLSATPIPGNEGDLAIVSPISILGGTGTPVIDASGLGHRHFLTNEHAGTFELTNVKLVSGSPPTGNGGCISATRKSRLILTSVTLEDCQATNGSGGAIASYGAEPYAANPVFEFQDVVLRNNSAGGEGGALYIPTQSVGDSAVVYRCEGCTIEGNTSDSRGGAVYLSGNARVELVDSQILDNEAGFNSGGIYSSDFSWATLQNVTLQGSTSGTDPVGYYGEDSSVLLIDGSFIRDRVIASDSTDVQATNTRFEMAAQPVIDLTDAILTLNDSFVVDNACVGCEEFAIRATDAFVELNTTVVQGNDGGLECDGCSLTVSRSSFVGNSRTSAAGDGAGVKVHGAGADVVFENSTFAGNTASIAPTGLSYGTGGGVYLGDGVAFEFNNVTIANNRGGGLHAGAAVAPLLSNTLLAGNLDGNAVSTFDSDCTGTVSSQGWNLIQIDPGCFSSPTVGDQVGVIGMPVFAQLDALTTVNGMPVHGLQAGSPARDAGNSTAPDGTAPRCETSDQVGTSRPQDGGNGAVCDIGAIEGSVVGDDVIFADDFETGGTGEWSSVG